MFESKEQKMLKFLQKENWEKIEKNYLNGDDATRLALAEACGNISNNISVNVLGILIRDKDKRVQLTAVKNLGKIGSEHHVAELQQLMQKVGPEDKELTDAIHTAIKAVRVKAS